MTTDPMVGRVLGSYELQAKLGGGGMGTVYRSVHRGLQQARAIKILRHDLALDPDVVERFRREATIAAGLRHPNVVLIYDVVEDGDLHYLVMELVEGVSLRQVVRSRHPVPFEQAIHLLRQLASALDYAHERGVIHRDVKPGNVMVGPGDRVTLVDFGIARAMDEARITRSGAVVGTAEYMAPESLTGTTPGRSADLYALGIVTYELLTGRAPFTGNATAVSYAQVHTPPPPGRTLRPDLPPSAERALLRQLSKDPAARYPTGAAFVDALAGSEAAESPTLPAIGPARQVPATVPTSFAAESPVPAPTTPPIIPAPGSGLPSPVPRSTPPRPPTTPPSVPLAVGGRDADPRQGDGRAARHSLPASYTHVSEHVPSAAHIPASSTVAEPGGRAGPSSTRRLGAFTGVVLAVIAVGTFVVWQVTAMQAGEREAATPVVVENVARAEAGTVVAATPSGGAVLASAGAGSAAGRGVAAGGGAATGQQPGATATTAAPASATSAAGASPVAASGPGAAAAGSATARATPGSAGAGTRAAPSPAPTPSPSSAPVFQTVFDESFADNHNGWPNDPNGKIWLDGGFLHLFAREPNRFIALGAPGLGPFRDVEVSGRFRKAGGPPGGGFGLIVRDQGPGPRDGLNQGGQYIEMEAGEGRQVGIWRRDQDHWVDLMVFTPNDAVRPPGEWNELIARAIGDHLIFIVNGTQVADIVDGTLSEGGVGIYVAGDGNVVEADQFTVRAPR